MPAAINQTFITSRTRSNVLSLRHAVLILTFSLLASATPQSRPAGLSPSRVLVVYPTNGPDRDRDGMNDSKQLADYYVQKRRIPAANVLGLNISVMQVGYYAREYSTLYKELVVPIKAKLTSLG